MPGIDINAICHKYADIFGTKPVGYGNKIHDIPVHRAHGHMLTAVSAEGEMIPIHL